MVTITTKITTDGVEKSATNSVKEIM